MSNNNGGNDNKTSREEKLDLIVDRIMEGLEDDLPADFLEDARLYVDCLVHAHPVLNQRLVETFPVEGQDESGKRPVDLTVRMLAPKKKKAR